MCRKSSQNTRTIFLIPHASWDGRVIRTLFREAFRSSHKFPGENGGGAAAFALLEEEEDA